MVVWCNKDFHGPIESHAFDTKPGESQRHINVSPKAKQAEGESFDILVLATTKYHFPFLFENDMVWWFYNGIEMIILLIGLFSGRSVDFVLKTN